MRDFISGNHMESICSVIEYQPRNCPLCDLQLRNSSYVNCFSAQQFPGIAVVTTRGAETADQIDVNRSKLSDTTVL